MPQGRFHNFYNSKTWKLRRLVQLQNHPLCAMCLERGIIKAAVIAHHVIPHRGDWEAFRTGELASTCKPCHDIHGQHEDKYGYRKVVDINGKPIDPEHPARKPRNPNLFSIPYNLKPSRVRVHLVCGAPGSGKTTYARKHASPLDVLIDFDDIRETVGGKRYDQNPTVLKKAFEYRDRLLHTLHTRAQGEAWLVVMAPTQQERKAWCKALGDVVVHDMGVGAWLCKDRIDNDSTWVGQRERLYLEVDKYFLKQKNK
jgi:5-methylcytosine-specific restriction enzyme A